MLKLTHIRSFLIRKHFYCLLFVCTSLFANALWAKPTVEDYGVLPTYESMKISPDGTNVAMLINSKEGTFLKVISLVNKKSPGTLGLGDTKPENFYFLNSDQVVLIASQRKFMPQYKDKWLNLSTAFLYDIPSNEYKQLLTPGDVIYKGQTGLGDITAVGDKGKYVYMPAFVPRSGSDQRPNFSLLKVKLAKPKRPKVHEKGKNNTIDYFIHPNGEVLAREDYSNSRNEHKIFAKQKGKWVEIFKAVTDFIDMSIVGITPDYKSLVVLKNDEKTGFTSYYRMSLLDGKFSKTSFGRNDADIDSVLTDRNRVVFGVRYSGFNPSYHFFDEKLNQLFKKVIDHYDGRSVYLYDWSEDWKHLIISVSGTGSPRDFYLLNDKGEASFLASGYPSIPPEKVHPIAKMAIKASDGLKIPTLLTIPKDKVNAMKHLPAVMMPHGGPEYYDQITFDWQAQALANEGYLVIQPQFRGSSGFGTDHVLAGRGEWGQKMQSDLNDTLTALIDSGYVDKNRVCIFGHSYGGYAALAGGAFTPELYRCVVSVNGVADLKRMLSDERSEHGRNHWVLSYWKEQFANDQKVDKEKLKSISPVYSAQNFTAPTLLIYGDEDETVNSRQSKIMEKALKKAGKNVKLIRLRGESHYMENRDTRVQMLTSVVDFINAELQN